MSKSSNGFAYTLSMFIIGVISFVIAGTVLVSASAAGFGARVLQPMPNASGNMMFSLFRTHWCGNGKIEYREACDDGNRINGDGCSRLCQKERPGACVGRPLNKPFIGPDGCNTCTCTPTGMACTKMYCPPKSSSSRSSVTSRSSSNVKWEYCISSKDCGSGQYCTTEDGDCRSSCPPGSESCIQVCAGSCRSTQCKPYVCPDGTRHPSCTEDGHVINYFADPCLTHQGSSSSRH